MRRTFVVLVVVSHYLHDISCKTLRLFLWTRCIYAACELPKYVDWRVVCVVDADVGVAD